MQIEFRRLNSLLEMCVARHDDAAVFFSFNDVGDSDWPKFSEAFAHYSHYCNVAIYGLIRDYSALNVKKFSEYSAKTLKPCC